MVGRLTIIVYRRGSRGSRRGTIRPVISSFKYVVNNAPASLAASVANTRNIATGTDTVAAGQTAPTGTSVPTGSIIKFLELHYTVSNLVSVTMNVHVGLQYTLSGQSIVLPNVVGGSAQRNQVVHQALFMVGKEQNSTHIIRFKVPKQFQRIREGMTWKLVILADQVSSQTSQFIYKFYR